MLKIKSIITININNKEYEFSCSPDSPIDEAIEANMQINAFLLGRKQQAMQVKLEEKKEE